ncbi:MAG: hypothetical protein NZZ41_00525 [Candidatus Dojkabacteria bacterium]|nr:hypothetical protein [Candidatus Dojkabacteria bacterium]
MSRSISSILSERKTSIIIRSKETNINLVRTVFPISRLYKGKQARVYDRPGETSNNTILYESYRFFGTSYYIQILPSITFPGGITTPLKYSNGACLNGNIIYFAANLTFNNTCMIEPETKTFITGIFTFASSPLDFYGGCITENYSPMSVLVSHNFSQAYNLQNNQSILESTSIPGTEKSALMVKYFVKINGSTSNIIHYFIPQNFSRFIFFDENASPKYQQVGPSYFSPFGLTPSLLPRRTACSTLDNERIIIKNPVSATNCVITVANLPITNSTTFSDVTPPFTDDIGKLTLMPDGRIFLTPRGATNIRIFDPQTNTITTGPAVNNTSADSYFSSVVLPNGRILLVPFNSTIFEIYDPVTNTVIPFGNAPGSGAFTDAVVAGNGDVYFVPGSVNQQYVLRMDLFNIGPGNINRRVYMFT